MVTWLYTLGGRTQLKSNNTLDSCYRIVKVSDFSKRDNAGLNEKDMRFVW